jgi:hypothetical protein
VTAGPPPAAAGGNQPQNNVPPVPKSAVPVRPSGVQVYAVKGDKDNSRNIKRVIDESTKTTWSTGKYKQPFPASKPGIGMLATFADATKLTSVTIDSPSSGTEVEIRSADSPTAKFGDTTVIGKATLGEGRTDIPVTGAEPGRYVLIWITKLGVSGKDNVTQIREIEFVRAQ